MAPPVFLTIAEQVACHIRTELKNGRWTETLPGLPTLAKELSVNSKTVEAGLHILESEGILVGRGAGRRRQIVLPNDQKTIHHKRVSILLNESVDQKVDFLIDLVHALESAGHTTTFTSNSLTDLGMDVKRVAHYVSTNRADAWIVVAASREILEWFSIQSVPAFALFGRPAGLLMPSIKPSKAVAHTAAARKLIEFGHRRIVLVCRELRRLPEPGIPERAFLDELEAHSVPAGKFNLPDWEESPEGFQKLLTSLFEYTPPTALILDEVRLNTAAIQFLVHRGIRVPGDVSLICTDPDPTFAWVEPPVAHIAWDSSAMNRRIVRWAGSASRGKPDFRQNFVPAKFIMGGTIGPARSRLNPVEPLTKEG